MGAYCGTPKDDTFHTMDVDADQVLRQLKQNQSACQFFAVKKVNSSVVVIVIKWNFARQGTVCVAGSACAAAGAVFYAVHAQTYLLFIGIAVRDLLCFIQENFYPNQVHNSFILDP